MPPIPENLNKWVHFAKQQKMMAVDSTDRGDIPPTVIVERDGEVQAIVVAPQIDRDMGLHAAQLLQIGFDPDAMTLVFDAHISRPKLKEGQTPEEAEEEFRKKYPKGMQAACDDEGACDLGEISDCLICHRIDRQGKISMANLPYSYHGKGGKPFKWVDEGEFQVHGAEDDGTKNTDDPNSMILKGLIPNALRKIMSQPPVLERIEGLKELAEKQFDFTPERARFHTARAVMHILATQEYMVVDYVTGTHPEWTDCKEKGKTLVERLVKKGLFPSEALEPLLALFAEHIGTAKFRTKFEELLKEKSYWLPNEVRNDIGKFVLMVETAVMSPDLPLPGGSDGRTGKRVRVWNGDKSKYLGEGNYVGEATVFAIVMPDGSLRSNSNAEEEPSPEDVPEGAEVRSVENNPKIVLDSGNTVYGCQVWWEFIPDEEPPPQSHPYNEHRSHGSGHGSYNEARD